MKTVVYFGSREIYQDFPRAVNSLLAHTKVDKIYAFIEDDQLPYDLPVECIRYTGEMFNHKNTRTKWKQFGCIRPALPKLLPDEDIILSLDLDTIVKQDISELWDLDITDYYFAAVAEPFLSGYMRKPYFNSGVCLMNLKLLRESGKADEMIHALNTYRFRFVAQDVLSFYCDKVLELPSDYNAARFNAFTEHVKIRHYADDPGWRDRL